MPPQRDRPGAVRATKAGSPPFQSTWAGGGARHRPWSGPSTAKLGDVVDGDAETGGVRGAVAGMPPPSAARGIPGGHPYSGSSSTAGRGVDYLPVGSESLDSARPRASTLDSISELGVTGLGAGLSGADPPPPTASASGAVAGAAPSSIPARRRSGSASRGGAAGGRVTRRTSQPMVASGVVVAAADDDASAMPPPPRRRSSASSMNSTLAQTSPSNNLPSTPLDMNVSSKIKHTRSRGGCVTCKAMKIRCDESNRPGTLEGGPFGGSCQNCIDKGRKCGGYVRTILFDKTRDKTCTTGLAGGVPNMSPEIEGDLKVVLWEPGDEDDEEGVETLLGPDGEPVYGEKADLVLLNQGQIEIDRDDRPDSHTPIPIPGGYDGDSSGASSPDAPYRTHQPRPPLVSVGSLLDKGTGVLMNGYGQDGANGATYAGDAHAVHPHYASNGQATQQQQPPRTDYAYYPGQPAYMSQVAYADSVPHDGAIRQPPFGYTHAGLQTAAWGSNPFGAPATGFSDRSGEHAPSPNNLRGWWAGGGGGAGGAGAGPESPYSQPPPPQPAFFGTSNPAGFPPPQQPFDSPSRPRPGTYQNQTPSAGFWFGAYDSRAFSFSGPSPYPGYAPQAPAPSTSTSDAPADAPLLQRIYSDGSVSGVSGGTSPGVGDGVGVKYEPGFFVRQPTSPDDQVRRRDVNEVHSPSSPSVVPLAAPGMFREPDVESHVHRTSVSSTNYSSVSSSKSGSPSALQNQLQTGTVSESGSDAEGDAPMATFPLGGAWQPDPYPSSASTQDVRMGIGELDIDDNSRFTELGDVPLESTTAGTASQYPLGSTDLSTPPVVTIGSDPSSAVDPSGCYPVDGDYFHDDTSRTVSSVDLFAAFDPSLQFMRTGRNKGLQEVFELAKDPVALRKKLKEIAKKHLYPNGRYPPLAFVKEPMKPPATPWTVSVMEDMLLDRFFQDTARMLVGGLDESKNPFRLTIFPVAGKHRSIFHFVIAVSAAHYATRLAHMEGEACVPLDINQCGELMTIHGDASDNTASKDDWRKLTPSLRSREMGAYAGRHLLLASRLLREDLPKQAPSEEAILDACATRFAHMFETFSHGRATVEDISAIERASTWTEQAHPTFASVEGLLARWSFWIDVFNAMSQGRECRAVTFTKSGVLNGVDPSSTQKLDAGELWGMQDLMGCPSSLVLLIGAVANLAAKAAAWNLTANWQVHSPAYGRRTARPATHLDLAKQFLEKYTAEDEEEEEIAPVLRHSTLSGAMPGTAVPAVQGPSRQGSLDHLASLVYADLLNWDYSGPGVQEVTGGAAVEARLSAECFQYAALVHLVRTVFKLPPHHKKVQELVREVMDRILQLPKNCLETWATFPYFVTGCEAIDEETQTFFKIRFMQMERKMGIVNLLAARQVMEQVWEARRQDPRHDVHWSQFSRTPHGTLIVT